MPTEPELARVDFCVSTFKRPRAIEGLILSIGEWYPQAAVYVADQNESFDRGFYDALAARSGLRKPPEVWHLGFDCGVSAARNHLVTSTPSEYKLILDDDFVFTEQTKVALLVGLLDRHPAAGVVAGTMWRNGRVRGLGCKFRREDDTLIKLIQGQPYLEDGGIRYRVVDFVCNFALMRRELFDHLQWDPALKLFEHADFYIRLMDTPYTALYTPDVVIDHPLVKGEEGYRRFRTREAFREQMLRKHGLSEMMMERQ